MEAGSTFLLSEEHQDIDKHLWVVLSDPTKNDREVLIVSLTTHKPHKDQACIVDPGEHPWVTHKTCVAYDFARTLSLEQLKELRYSGSIQLNEPVSKALLARIRQSAGNSVRLKMKYADLLIDQGLLEC